MKLEVGKTYTIQVGQYPWSDDYAKNHLLGGGCRLFTEAETRRKLDGQRIRVTSLSAYYEPKGDRGLTCKWIEGVMVSGEICHRTVFTVASWLGPLKCYCPTRQLVTRGCSCGGI